jgi:hypothetical protein
MKMEIESQDLKALIKEAIREVLKEENFNYFMNSIPYVSDVEMDDIRKIYGKPGERIVADSEDLEL